MRFADSVASNLLQFRNDFWMLGGRILQSLSPAVFGFGAIRTTDTLEPELTSGAATARSTAALWTREAVRSYDEAFPSTHFGRRGRRCRAYQQGTSQMAGREQCGRTGKVRSHLFGVAA
jgi:hypothetical protein